MAQQSWNRLYESNQMWAVIKWSAGVVTSGHKDLGTKSETKTQNFPTFCVGSILTDFSNNSVGCWAAVVWMQTVVMEEGCPSPTTRMWYLSGIQPINTVKCDGCYTWLSRMHCCFKWTYGSFRWINPLHYKCLPEMYPWEPSRASQVITICTARIEMNLNLYCWLCSCVQWLLMFD